MGGGNSSQGGSKPVKINDSLSEIAKIRPGSATTGSAGNGQGTDKEKK
jgi:hypothetical protein